jgi:hypothetical protein
LNKDYGLFLLGVLLGPLDVIIDQVILGVFEPFIILVHRIADSSWFSDGQELSHCISSAKVGQRRPES